MKDDKPRHGLRSSIPFGLAGMPVVVLHLSLVFLLFTNIPVCAQSLTFVELNCENLFDCRHDTLKQDLEFTPEGGRHWTRTKFWRKLNNIAQTILSCSSQLPDLVALVEVENDSVLHSLTRRSLLREAGYDYLMTTSPDVRGIDVALLYQPAVFRPLCYETLTIVPTGGMRPTRDILYVKGEQQTGDTLHVFVVHAPSRYGGERKTRPHRMLVAKRLAAAVDSLLRHSAGSRIIVAGDFNDPLESRSLRHLQRHGLCSATPHVRGTHGARSNYRYHGRWEQIDHVFCSPSLLPYADTAYVNDMPFLLEDDPVYGGVKPRRTFDGYRYQQGFSDHLPLVVRFRFSPSVPASP